VTSFRESGGFTLLETMVAMVLLASVGMALFGLFNTNISSLIRVKDVSRQLPVVYSAVDALAAEALLDESEGELSFDGIDVRWTVSQVGDFRDSQTITGYRGYYRVGLYRIDLELYEKDRLLGRHSYRQAGYEKVRGPDDA